MNRRLFLFAVPAISFLKPKSLAQRLGDALKQYQAWLNTKTAPTRPPTKTAWDAMTQAERDAIHMPTMEQWQASAERWRAFMGKVHRDRVDFVKKVNL